MSASAAPTTVRPPALERSSILLLSLLEVPPWA